MELSNKYKVPEILEIPILDGEEWDMSFAIDQHQKILIPKRTNQVNTTTKTDINQAE
jgi:hypothetical protein